MYNLGQSLLEINIRAVGLSLKVFCTSLFVQITFTEQLLFLVLRDSLNGQSGLICLCVELEPV